MYATPVAKYSKVRACYLEEPLPDGLGSVVMPGASALPVVVTPPTYLLVRFEPVAARVIGPGTSSVMPTGAVGFNLPDGAVLVSPAESTTST
jgi:hypothetical protein